MLVPHDSHPRPRSFAHRPGVHWAARPMPLPVRSKKVSRRSQEPQDHLGEMLDQWIEELRANNTLGGD